VRTKGARWSPGGADRSWLLIKHRDDWAGDIDIAAFAPLSVKSEGDFADILSRDNPDIWQSQPPAKGGAAGAMYKSIIARAIEMRSSGSGSSSCSVSAEPTTKKTTAGNTPARKRR
jgi:hypothetical protein